MSYKEYIGHKAIRNTKFLLMCIACLVALRAYNLDVNSLNYYDNGSNTYDRLIALYCTIITFNVTWEYLKDNWLRLISGTMFLICFNNLLDELFFNPLVTNTNEIVFGCMVGLNFVYSLIMYFKDGNKPEQPQ